MKLCRENGWKYIFTQKAGRQKTAAESYDWIESGGGKTEKREHLSRERDRGIY